MPTNNQYKFGGASSIGDLAKAGGDVEELTITAIKNGKFGSWSDYAKQVSAVAIAGTPDLTATEDAAYTFTVTASGGVAPYIFALVGTWPDGVTIDDESGVVSGPAVEGEAGSYADLSVSVTDAWKQTDQLDAFTLVVAAD